MELKNNGTFSVVYRKEIEKFVVVYNEKGILTPLNKYNFDLYDVAFDYVNTHTEELDKVITELKEVEIKKKEEEERKKREQEETERKKKEEAERKKQEKVDEKKKKKEQKLAAKNKKKEKREKKRNQRRKKVAKIWKEWKRFVAGLVTAAILLVGGHWAAFGISSAVKNNKTNNKEDSSMTSDSNTNATNPTIEPTVNVDDEEVLTNEVYEEIVTNFTKQYVDRNVNVTTEDLVKFVSIANIDKLVEDNPELANELFSQKSKEEYLNDAAKVIGMTYTYNRQVFENEQSTENFIRVSDAISGAQKEAVKEIEEYVDKIALARNDAEEANRLISELIYKLGDPTSNLSYLDDGVGFAIQSNIELIRSYLAKDVISKENLDMLTTLTSSEEYVSNIFVVYDKCINTAYVLRRG